MSHASRLLVRMVLGLCLSLASARILADQPPATVGLRAPDGFEVSRYADDSLAHDIYSMAVDAQGRVVVSGPGYVKILEDTDGDGRADAAKLFSSKPASGAHGMLFDGPDLICTGDNTVMRLTDANGDDQADGPPEVWANLRNPEHGANGLARGPDGWIYLICGNDAGVSEKHTDIATSPVKLPRCGAVVRFSPDGKKSEVFAHGFRNPYDLDFNAGGQVFTVDSDGERDFHLPWYAPTRLFDIQQGREHGWLLAGWTRSWNRPQSFFDSAPRLVEIGRGSPTGLTVYRHRQFPEQYRGGVFSACWTLGRVYYLPLKPEGASYRSESQVFLQTSGDVGFAPCDLAVGPEGDLFVAIGGRRTQGSVFRVRYKQLAETLSATTDLKRVLLADQPLSSWSRANWLPLAKQLGGAAFTTAVLDQRLSVSERVRAVEILAELFAADADVAGVRAVLKSEIDSPEVQARVAWMLGRSDFSSAGYDRLASLTGHTDPRVVRAAWEALATYPEQAKSTTPPAWEAGLDSSDRHVRTAAIQAALSGQHESFEAYASERFVDDRPPVPVRVKLAELWMRHSYGGGRGAYEREYVETCLAVWRDTKDPLVRLEVVRLLQLKLGDLRTQPDQAEVYSGYMGNHTLELHPTFRRSIAEKIAAEFPFADAELNREAARLVGMLGIETDGILYRISERWTAESTPADDIHYLIVTSLLPGTRSREVTNRTATALLQLHAKLFARGEHASQNWPFRVGETFASLCQRDEALGEALVEHMDFKLAAHTLFTRQLEGDQRDQAARRLLAAAIDRDDDVTSELVELVGTLPDAESRAFLRRLWSNAALRDAIALVLARRPDEEDRAKLVEALASVQPRVVQQASGALAKLDKPAQPSELIAVLQALRRACLAPDEKLTRQALAGLLTAWTAEQIVVVEQGKQDLRLQYGPWFEWFAQNHPQEAKQLGAAGTDDARAWADRFAKVNWTDGDAARGRQVFEKRACHRCHQAAGQLGPELKGAAGRMSREDLFAAIIDPSKEVSPTFQTTVIATEAGQVYHGLVVYESPESTLLQTTPDTTVRITGVERANMRRSTQSLMPTGLLNGLGDADLADLYQYLKTLGSQ